MNQLLKKKSAGRFLMDWAAVIELAVSFVIFKVIQGGAFFSAANAINILRAMAITTIFAIAATVTMAPDGFDMSACTLASFSAYVFASTFLWFGLPLWASILATIVFTMVMYLLTMFLILVCKIPDMLATCSLTVSYTHLRAHETGRNLVCRLLLEKKKKKEEQKGV